MFANRDLRPGHIRLRIPLTVSLIKTLNARLQTAFPGRSLVAVHNQGQLGGDLTPASRLAPPSPRKPLCVSGSQGASSLLLVLALDGRRATTPPLMPLSNFRNPLPADGQVANVKVEGEPRHIIEGSSLGETPRKPMVLKGLRFGAAMMRSRIFLGESGNFGHVAKALAESSGNLFEQHCSGDESTPPQSAVHWTRGAGAKRTISDLHFPEAFFAAKESVGCHDLKELQSRLTTRLGQNSQETRLRYARFLIRWFFSDGLDGIARKTWIAYQDEKILADVLRFLYLTHEPVMGACVAECLFPVDLGMNRVRYDRRDAMNLLDTFARNNPPTQSRKTPGSISLREASRSSVLPHAAFVPIVKAVMNGFLSPVSRTCKRARLMEYVFAEQDLIRVAKQVLKGSLECINVTQTAHMLQTSPRKIKRLLDEGVLSSSHRNRQGINIPSSQVRAFGKKFVSLESVATALAKSCSAVIAEAKTRGISLFEVEGKTQFIPKKGAATLLYPSRMAELEL